MVSPSSVILVSLILFFIGAIGVVLRKNAIVMFMCIELMLNGVNVAFVGFSQSLGNLDGQIAVFFVMVVAAAEAAVGLALFISCFRSIQSINTDDVSILEG